MSDGDLRLYEGDVVHLGNGLGRYEIVEARHRRTKPDRYHCKQIDGDGVVWWGSTTSRTCWSTTTPNSCGPTTATTVTAPAATNPRTPPFHVDKHRRRAERG